MPRNARVGPSSPAIPEVKPFEGAQVLARVGSDVILASEVMPAYEEILSRIPESELARYPQHELEVQKKALIATILQERVKTKLIYQDAKRTIPEERLPDIHAQIAKHFEEGGLDQAVELREGLATLGPQGVRRIQNRRNTLLLGKRWERYGDSL